TVRAREGLEREHLVHANEDVLADVEGFDAAAAVLGHDERDAGREDSTGIAVGALEAGDPDGPDLLAGNAAGLPARVQLVDLSGDGDVQPGDEVLGGEAL